eukprot:scpid43126/ scgid28040/ Suppressor of cytokine signaling 6
MSAEVILQRYSPLCLGEHCAVGEEKLLRCNSLSTLNYKTAMDDSATSALRKQQRWKTGISSIKRKLARPTANTTIDERTVDSNARPRSVCSDTGSTLTRRSLDQSFPSLAPSSAAESDRKLDRSAESPTESISAEQRRRRWAATRKASQSAVNLSSTSASGTPAGFSKITERFRLINDRGSRSGLNRCGERQRGDAHVSLVYGISHNSTTVPDGALCVNPFFMSHIPQSSRGSEPCSTPVFRTPMPAAEPATGKLSSGAWQSNKRSSTYFSFHRSSSSVSERPAPQTPSSHEDLCRSSSSTSNESNVSSGSSSGSDTPFSPANRHSKLVRCSPVDSGNAMATTTSPSSESSASDYSFSSTSCASWSQDASPSHDSPTSAYQQTARIASRNNTFGQRPLPAIPVMPGWHQQEADEQDDSDSEGEDPQPSTRLITPSSSTSSLHEIVLQSHLLGNFNTVKRLSWYWGPLSREESETVLGNGTDGDFLLRDSSTDRDFFVLSVRCNGETVHVLADNKQLDVQWPGKVPERFQDMLALLHPNIKQNKVGQAFAPAKGVDSGEVFFTRPLRRYSHVPTLQHLCRLTLRANCLLSHEEIVKLDLPKTIKTFLDQPNVYTE